MWERLDSGWRFTCERCGLSMIFQRKTKRMYCDDCAIAVKRKKPKEALRKAAERRKRVRTEPVEYCERMRIKNPGKACGSYEFCRKCKHEVSDATGPV